MHDHSFIENNWARFCCSPRHVCRCVWVREWLGFCEFICKSLKLHNNCTIKSTIASTLDTNLQRKRNWFPFLLHSLGGWQKVPALICHFEMQCRELETVRTNEQVNRTICFNQKMCTARAHRITKMHMPNSESIEHLNNWPNVQCNRRTNRCTHSLTYEQSKCKWNGFICIAIEWHSPT